MFANTPEAVVKGAEKAAQFAQINQENVRAVNEEYCRMLTKIIQESFQDKPKQLAKWLESVKKLKASVATKFYRPADINAELSQAIAAYLKTPSLGISNILSLLQAVAVVSPGQ